MGSTGAWRSRSSGSTPTFSPRPSTTTSSTSGVGAAPTSQATARGNVQGQWLSDADVVAMRGEMGQTGLEAGDPNASPQKKVYVKTSKAFNINAYLNSDGKTIHSKESDWDNLGYTKSDVEAAIRQIDAGMKPLSRDIKVSRFVGGSSLEKMFGLKFRDSNQMRAFIDKLDSNSSMQSTFKDVLQATSYTHKAYTSTTTQPSHPSFGDRAVRIDISMKKGTPAIMTSNIAEHEVLAGRGLSYNFDGKFHIETVTDSRGNKKKQLVIEAYV